MGPWVEVDVILRESFDALRQSVVGSGGESQG